MTLLNKIILYILVIQAMFYEICLCNRLYFMKYDEEIGLRALNRLHLAYCRIMKLKFKYRLQITF